MKVKAIIIGVVLLIATIATLLTVEVTTIKGHQLGIMETWSGGVEANTYSPRTYMLIPGFTKNLIPYDMSQQVTALQDYRVQSQEGQDLKIDVSFQWRRDPSKLRKQHMEIRENIDAKLITPVLQRIIKDEATAKKAIDVYSGEGLVALQASIQRHLAAADGEFAEKGVIVENFVIRHIELDPKYIEEIKGRQIATQRQLRAVEEQKAAEAEALVAKAKAQADLNKMVVEAQRDKEVAVLGAKAANEKTILQAQADQEKAILTAKGEQQKLTLEAEGKMQAALSEAKGIEALGLAKANAQRQQLEAYKVQGSELYARVEISKNVAEAFKGIKGYLPADMKVNLLTENFNKSVDVLTGNVVVNPAK